MISEVRFQGYFFILTLFWATKGSDVRFIFYLHVYSVLADITLFPQMSINHVGVS